MRAFDASLVDEEGPPHVRTTSVEEIANRLGASTDTLTRAEAHVAAMDRYPFLDTKGWSQAAVLEVAAGLAAIEQTAPAAHGPLVLLLSALADPPVARAAVSRWVSGSPEKQRRMAEMIASPAPEDRCQIEAYLADNKLQPDARRARLADVTSALKFCIRTEDQFTDRFQRLLAESQALAQAIQQAEEDSYGWLRKTAEDRP
jgi:hypothetical protein